MHRIQTTGESKGSEFNSAVAVTDPNESVVTGIKAAILSDEGRYRSNETIGVDRMSPEKTRGLTRGSVAEPKKVVGRSLDKSLLARAQSIVDSLDLVDVEQATVDFESLRGIIIQLWESAVNASQFHQDILAILESAMLSVDLPGANHLPHFREAIRDLCSDALTGAHVDVIRRRFINAGFSPLVLLGELNNEDAST